METQKWTILSWTVEGLIGKHKKYIVRNWVRSVSPLPLIIGLQELKTSFFLTTVTLNAINLTIKELYPYLLKEKAEQLYFTILL